MAMFAAVWIQIWLDVQHSVKVFGGIEQLESGQARKVIVGTSDVLLEVTKGLV